jgi:hypothetical protein
MQVTDEDLYMIACIIELNEAFTKFKGSHQSKYMRPMVLFNEITFWKYVEPSDTGSIVKSNLKSKKSPHCGDLQKP